MNQEDQIILELIKDKKYLLIANKSDLQKSDGCSDAPSPLVGEGWGEGLLHLSTVTKEGFEELKLKIKEFVGDKSIEDTEFITNNRQQDCLEKSRESLEQALLATQIKEHQDLISIDVKSALLYLDEITGEVITDDILNNIFDNFCIGK